MYNFPTRYRVPFDESFNLYQAPQQAEEDFAKKVLKKRLKKAIKELKDLQRVLYAHDHYAVLLVFQAMDAAGKDSTIRAIMSGVNPAGCQVFSFKQPSAEALDHDFLWRSARRLTERGRIGIFNRSYYEETLVVRVHPEYLDKQKLPVEVDRSTLWKDRFESIRNHELHLAQNGTVILKFWLNVSRDEQKERFFSRLDRPEKNWKFSMADVAERQHWDEYMQAYQAALNATSRAHAPWYAIPADNKKYMRAVVAETVVETLKALQMHYPTISQQDQVRFAEARALLEAEGV